MRKLIWLITRSKCAKKKRTELVSLALRLKKDFQRQLFQSLHTNKKTNQMFNDSPKKPPSEGFSHLPHSKNVDWQFFPDSAIKTVLIADEEAEIRDALSVAVRRWAQEEQRNVEIVVFENGQKAVNYIEQVDFQNRPFLAILDLRMPQMNGLESAQILNERYPEMPIIITASHDEIDEQLIQEADEFANQNSRMGFVIRTNSSSLLKVVLEFEIRKLVFSEDELIPENIGLFRKFQGTLSQLLKF